VIAAEDLLKPLKDREWLTDGTSIKLTFAGRPVIARLIAEDGKVNVNGASLDTLTKLFSVIQGPQDPVILASTVLRGRANDDSGDEFDDPTTPSPGHRARYASIEEIRAVPGITPALYRAICSLITVNSSRAFPNQRSMPAELRPILLRTETGPDFADNSVDSSVTAQPGQILRNGVSRNEAQFQSPAYSLTVAVAGKGRQHAPIYRAIFRLSLNPALPPLEVLHPLRPVFEEDCRSYLR
jgi:hypothetical protein